MIGDGALRTQERDASARAEWSSAHPEPVHGDGYARHRPAPAVLGTQELHNELLRERLLVVHHGTAAAELISARNRLADFKRWSGCDKGAKFLTACIKEELTTQALHLARSAELMMRIEERFREWCREQGTVPGMYRDLSYEVS